MADDQWQMGEYYLVIKTETAIDHRPS